MKYDFVIVGAGLFGSVFAHEMTTRGKKCLVIEKRDHIGGNCYTEDWDGIQVHLYGAHVFRTSDKNIWHYINQFSEFNHFVNSPIANFHGEIYNLPFNMNTFNKMWGVRTPKEAKEVIQKQREEIKGTPSNLEEQAISLVGRDLFEKLIKGYTEKKWGRSCKDLPASFLRRILVRFNYDNNYYNDIYQGVPIGGYTQIFEKLLDGSDVILNTDFDDNQEMFSSLAQKVLYTGPIDKYFSYCYGALQYRSLRFEHERINESNYQGVAVVNYTDRETPYIRTVEHKHFEFRTEPFTIISREYPLEWKEGIEPYYPINNSENQSLFERYKELSRTVPNLVFGGRLGAYKYTDMNETIQDALDLVCRID